MGQVRCSTSRNESMIGRNRQARGHEEHCRGDTGRRKRPSTQASFKVRESKGQGQTGVVRFFFSEFANCPHIGRKRPMLDRRGQPCQATRRVRHAFLASTIDSSPVRGCCEGESPRGRCSPFGRPHSYTQFVDNYVEKWHMMLGGRTEPARLDQGKGAGVYQS